MQLYQKIQSKSLQNYKVNVVQMSTQRELDCGSSLLQISLFQIVTVLEDK